MPNATQPKRVPRSQRGMCYICNPNNNDRNVCGKYFIHLMFWHKARFSILGCCRDWWPPLLQNISSKPAICFVTNSCFLAATFFLALAGLKKNSDRLRRGDVRTRLARLRSQHPAVPGTRGDLGAALALPVGPLVGGVYHRGALSGRPSLRNGESFQRGFVCLVSSLGFMKSN